MRAYNTAVYQHPAGNAAGAPPAPEKNRREVAEEKNGILTLGFWLALALLYILWDVFILRTKAKDVVDPQNIRTNLYNLFVIGIGAVVFVNGFKVLLVKIAAWEIPGISWLAKQFVPLFQL